MFVKRSYRKLFLGMIGTLFSAYCATCLYLYFYQRYIIFNPKESIETLPNAPRLQLYRCRSLFRLISITPILFRLFIMD
jgi:hypothetical protein